MMKKLNILFLIRGVLFLLLLTAGFGAGAAPTVQGYVYEDANRNGRKDRREAGIGNIAVSNGREVVLTDVKGKYVLPVNGDNIIFVIKPAGYRIETDEYNLPCSFHIHKPGGSPPLRYEGAKPTGNLPASLDFALVKYDEKETFTSLVFGDSQIYNEDEANYFERGIVDEAKTLTEPVFGITLGDLVGDNLNLHLTYKNAVKKIGLPWYNVMGNHDMNYDAKADSLSDETFEANFGPASYAFNYGKAHFIVLDDILYPDPVDGKGYRGGFRNDQLDFVQNDLQFVPRDRLIVICLHIPLISFGEAFVEDGRQKLLHILDGYPNVLILSAHTHYQTQHFAGKEKGLNREKPVHEYNVGTSCGDWYSGVFDEKGIPVATMRDGTPKGYALLSVDGNQYALDYRVAGKPADYRINLYCAKLNASEIFANFFMGDSSSVLEYRVNQGEWKKMRKTEDYDPSYYHYVQEWDYIEEVRQGRRPSNPVRCTHLWHANIPSNLPAGKHTVEVRTTDRYGKTFSASKQYEKRK
ncbi:MAG: calcineurin-like phosphoesterase C-terminal domain-containing protein [Prevotellaceae bacterium]|jgi:3',5'-cyclic AMP phosphodiesterase CpdA|nr:calcineurin-like phosphoesterase C-terminal domain-containing protein [Prevotellaceae bacterium]